MACSIAVQETFQGIEKGNHPTTSNIRPRLGQLFVLSQSRQVFDFEKVGQSKDRPNANRFYQENGFGTSVMVQFIIGVKDLITGELWNCTIRNKQRQLVLDNGLFIISVKINPNGLVCFPMTDIKQNKLPDYLCNVKCILPVEADEPLIYCVKIILYQNGIEGKRKLNEMQFIVHTHERGHDMYDYKEGRAIIEVERPQLKIKMTGVLAEHVSRELLMHFQKLGDDGCYRQFYIDQNKLLKGLEKLERKFGNGYYKDLELSIKLEESITLFVQHKLDDCVRVAKEVIRDAENLANGVFLLAKAHYIISAVFRQRSDLVNSEKHMELSTEILEQVVVCEETAVNQYNWAALLSERSARSSLTSAEQKDAEFRFKNCRLHWNHQNQNTTNREPMRNQIRNIHFHLRTTRKDYPNPRTPVAEESLAKAAQAIHDVEENLLETCAKRHKATYFIAKSDYYIRKLQMNGILYTREYKDENARIAVKILEEALNIAEECELKNEEKGIKDRLKNLWRLLWPDREWREDQQQQQQEEKREPEEHNEDLMAEYLEELDKISEELQDIAE